jgi:hypothetical protein
MDLARCIDQEVFRLAANCICEIMKAGPRRALAQQRLDAVNLEIAQRCRGRTDIGVLVALGYHVGFHDPVERDRRRAILRYVFGARLPRVSDDDYMARWGEPLSEVRRHRIAGTLRWFIERHSWNPDMSRACTEWTADQEFVMGRELAAPLVPMP